MIMNDDQQALTQFGGTARLFPLPNLVFFPQVIQPLHIFEPRYRQLTADALGGDKLIAMALLKPGWESDYDGTPPTHPIACLGRVVAEQSLADGRYNLLLRGLSRIRIGADIETGLPYRTARAKLLSDGPLPEVDVAMALRKELSERVLPRFAATDEARGQLRDLFQGELPLGPLCDVLSFALPLGSEEKQELLELLDVTMRAQRLIEQIEGLQPAAAATGDRRFPPDFSSN
jgi:Lon protease-like protein